MFTEIVFSLIFWTYGVLSIVYAFHEPPARIAWLFNPRIPLLFGLVLAFVDDDHRRIKIARIGMGVLFLVGSLSMGLKALYNVLLSWF